MDICDRYLAVRNAMINIDCTPTNRHIPFTPRPDDVIIAGVPKSGTTWMQQILHQIRTKGDESFREIYEMVPYLDYNDISFFDINADHVANPRVFKSHALYENMPKLDGKTRFVVIVRDPYDMQLSLVKFLWRYIGTDQDVNPAEYDKLIASWPVGDFASFIKSWWPHRNEPNVLFILYEDLKDDLASYIRKVADFIGVTLDEAAFSKILRFCSFEYMSQHREKFTNDGTIKAVYKKANLEDQPILCGMVRLDGGQVGQGKIFLDESIRLHIDKRWKEIMEKDYGWKNYQDLLQTWRKERCGK